MKLDEVEGFGVLEDLRECDEFSDLVLGFVIFCYDYHVIRNIYVCLNHD
jgi:hypothetical protein